VTGKGGTGKTTVCAALGVAGARGGRRVLVIETGRSSEVPSLLSAARLGTSTRERETSSDGVETLRLDPFDALAEYLTLQFGFGRLVRRVVAHRGFHQLLEGAPGWRELITLGKIWHMVERGDPLSRPDLVVVDAPATGHGLTFLDVPRVASAAVRAGPLRRHAGWVEALVRDPKRTLLLPVARPEELPARETVELVARMRDEVQVPVDRIVMNAFDSPPPGVALAELEQALKRADQLAPNEALRHAVRDWRVRSERSEHWTGELARATGLPIVPLPYEPGGPAGAESFALLANALLAPESPAP